MKFYSDTYGLALLPSDWFVDLLARRVRLGEWYDKQDALMAEVADHLMALLDITMTLRRGAGFPIYVYSDEDGDGLDLFPNFDGDDPISLQEEDYKNFPLILTARSRDLDLLLKLEKRFAEARELHMTLLRRRVRYPNSPNPPDTLFKLPPTTPEGDNTDAEASSDSDVAS